MEKVSNRQYLPPSTLSIPFHSYMPRVADCALGDLAMDEDFVTGDYVPAHFLAHPELAAYDWPKQSPLDILFFSEPMEGDIPSPPRC